MKTKHPTPLKERLLTTPVEIFTTLIGELQHARKSIDMEFYIFEGDRIGTTITNILCRKARQGLHIRLLVDGYGSRNLPRRLRQQMRASGIEFRYSRRLGHCRNHRKMIIIDRNSALVGGINIADRYISGNNLGVWHDAALHLTGEIVKGLSALFEYDFAQEPQSAVDISQATTTPALYWSESGGGECMARLLKDIVESAEREITFTTPYFMPPRTLLNIFSVAIRRGVRIRVIIPERCDILLLDDVIRHSINEARALGVEILVIRGSFIHAKMAVVDSRRVVIGSANLDSRSLSLNRELMISTSNRSICHAARLFVDRLLQMTTPPREDERKCYLPRIFIRSIMPLM